jgi:hypothetical protein
MDRSRDTLPAGEGEPGEPSLGAGCRRAAATPPRGREGLP